MAATRNARCELCSKQAHFTASWNIYNQHWPRNHSILEYLQPALAQEVDRPYSAACDNITWPQAAPAAVPPSHLHTHVSNRHASHAHVNTRTHLEHDAGRDYAQQREHDIVNRRHDRRVEQVQRFIEVVYLGDEAAGENLARGGGLGCASLPRLVGFQGGSQAGRQQLGSRRSIDRQQQGSSSIGNSPL